MEDTKAVEEAVLAALKDRPEKCMCFDEIIDMFSNPETKFALLDVIGGLNNLVRRGLVRRFRAIHCGSPHNHYKLVE